MKLSKEQIDQLFIFTRQHFVEWYDLQSELVDHLANAIENEWKENPKLTFDEVLNKEFMKFGVFGFMDVVEKRQAALGKKYHGLVWQHFKEFFAVPKIILTIAMTLGLFIILKISQYSEWIILGLYLILIVFTFYEIFKNKKIQKQKRQSGQKRWLFEEIINQYGGILGIIIFPINLLSRVFYHSEKYIGNDYWVLGLSFFFVLLCIVICIIFKVIPSRAEEYLLATYPEYKSE